MSTFPLPGLVALSLSACLLAVSALAHAESDDDGLYGRLSGDIHGSLSAGASVRVGDGPGLGASARAHYLSSAGVYVGFDAGLHGGPTARQTLGTGVSLRPLFLPRWGSDLQKGPAWLDLTIDSVALELGALWTWQQGTSLKLPGLELALGVEIPLQSRARGLWIAIRTALQWTALDLASAVDPLAAPSVLVGIGLSWHGLTNLHLADAGDQVLR